MVDTTAHSHTTITSHLHRLLHPASARYTDNRHAGSKSSSVEDAVTCIQNADYQTVLSSILSTQLLSYIDTLTDTDTTAAHQLIADKLTAVLDAADEDVSEVAAELFVTGVAALLQYTQYNYTGPPPPPKPTTDHNNSASTSSSANTLLQLNGEDVYEYSVQPVLLVLARSILLHDRISQTIKSASPLCLSVWQLRCLWLQQQLHTAQIEQLRVNLAELCDQIQAQMTTTAKHDSQLQCVTQLELVPIHLYYYRYTDAADCMLNAAQTIGFTAELTGVLGTRTKFQTNKISQLVVTTSADSADSYKPTSDTRHHTDAMPQNIAIDSDTVLNDMQLDTDDSNVVTDMNILQKAVLLARIHYVQTTQPSTHTTVQAELAAYVNAVLKHDQLAERCWPFEVVALYQRSLLERLEHHKQVRSIQQLESIVQSYTHCSDTVPYTQHVAARMQYVYGSTLQTQWAVKTMLAQCLTASGLHKSALDVYMDIKLHERVIEILILLGRQSEAIELINKQLEVESSSKPLLYCLLGDIYNNDTSASYYTQAWDTSHHKYPRAQRSLGRYYRVRSQWAEAIEAYQLAVRINPSLPSVWFEIGHCAYQLQQYDTCAQAYTRSVTLDGSNGEAWNNLATAHIQMNNYKSGFVALEQAVKLKMDSYQTWRNYMICAINIAEYSKAVYAVKQVVMCRPKESRDTVSDVDALIGVKTLNVLSQYVSDSNDEFVRRQFISALDVIVQQLGGSAVVHGCYAGVYEALKEYQATFDYRGKQVNELMLTMSTAQQCQTVTDACKMLYDTVQLCNTKDNIYTCRTLLNTIVGKMQRSQLECDDMVQELTELVQALKTMQPNNSEQNWTKPAASAASPYLSMWQ